MYTAANNPDELNNEKVNEILEVIMSYARLDFSKKTQVDGKEDILTAIGAGVNMLGEELENSTISLKEKDHLIKEIHHRVKNNMQIVSSLLSLQSENIVDEHFLSLISGSRNRINSMALVHEMLYASKDLTKIEIGEYIKRLSKNVFNSLLKPSSNIQFQYSSNTDYFFDIDIMIPVALILNEVMTNSIKYAFPDNNGTISVTLNVQADEKTFCIKDDGIGFPKDFNFETQSRLGLQLIKMLTEQINGDLNINFVNGTSYTITFR